MDRQPADDAGARIERLSPRQLQVLRLICQGRSHQAIAAALDLSVRTVRNHLTAAYHELGLITSQSIRNGIADKNAHACYLLGLAEAARHQPLPNAAPPTTPLDSAGNDR